MSTIPTYLNSLEGGALIGLSSAMLMVLNGRVAGISGIVSSLFRWLDPQSCVNAAFVVGLIAGPFVFRMVFQAWPHVEVVAPISVIIAASM